MLIEDIEKKIKLSFTISAMTIVSCCIICVTIFFMATKMVKEERKNIYVLSGEIPIMASQTSQIANLDVEAKSHIQMFHNFFFTLPPDDQYINYTTEKAMYLIDESGLTQKNALQEKGFYAGIMSQSASFSIMCDSIYFDKDLMSFTYFGTQRIERKTTILKRKLVTEGKLRQIPRSANNPHGLIITDYKTITNTDLEYKLKTTY
ncbi:conjugative transposon protein TraK [Bacteroidia bacterium]|nr:conjugative transposon protein TraK [Bacteroidia bacterium]GHT61543.1 conjugative transposon protein TraK [Bacteroidia bacterium]